MVRKDFHDKIEEFIKILRKKEVYEIKTQDIKHIISEYFGNDRNNLNFIFKHLLKIGFLEESNPGIMKLNFEIEEIYHKDRLFFMEKM